ncbi:hypothetical protein N183_37330 [Sinorhizobium sp. Sb3]|nr:hypothetical protein N183_37330 [Sinorhizobium sp. Sb3]
MAAAADICSAAVGSKGGDRRQIDDVGIARLERDDLPSITGFDASAPRFPRPRMAVPLEITATMLPRVV